MDLGAVAEAAELMEKKQTGLTEEERNFLFRFACTTGDRELTEKLFKELTEKGTDKKAVFQRYEVLEKNQPDWIRRVENLLVSLELYRMEEERAIKRLSEILEAYGVDLTVEELKEIPQNERKEQLIKKEKMAR